MLQRLILSEQIKSLDLRWVRLVSTSHLSCFDRTFCSQSFVETFLCVLPSKLISVQPFHYKAQLVYIQHLNCKHYSHSICIFIAFVDYLLLHFYTLSLIPFIIILRAPLSSALGSVHGHSHMSKTGGKVCARARRMGRSARSAQEPGSGIRI